MWPCLHPPSRTSLPIRIFGWRTSRARSNSNGFAVATPHAWRRWPARTASRPSRHGSAASSIRRSGFRWSRRSATASTTSGGMPHTPRGCGGGRRSTNTGSLSLPGRPCSTSMRSRCRRGKTGSGMAPPCSSRRIGSASCRSPAVAPTPTWCGSSTWKRRPSWRAVLHCRRPRAASPGGVPTVCSWPPTSVPGRSPPQDTRGRSASGPVARRFPPLRSSTKASPTI